MSLKLVTIATFDEPVKARLAFNLLQDAGIQSVVADESLVAMDWLLSNAVGGVKVQVREEDAERAVDVLNESLNDGGFGPTTIEPDDLEAQAEAEPREEAAAHEDDAPDAPETPAPALTREDYARRMVFASLLAVFFPPVAFYSFYLLMNAIFSPGELSSRGRLNLWIGAAFTLAILLWMAWILEVIF